MMVFAMDCVVLALLTFISIGVWVMSLDEIELDRMLVAGMIDKFEGERESVQDRLKGLIELGISQYELSLLLGVSEAAVSYWVSGSRVPRGLQTHRHLDLIELHLGL